MTPGLAGLDVSHFQQTIDWFAVAAAGVQYCFIKATEGSSRLDQLFAENWQRSNNAGIIRGAYHLFRPAVPVTKQVDFFLATVRQLQPGDLPPVLDLEVPADWTNIPIPQRAPLAVQWLEAVEAGLGLAPIVYLSPAFMNNTLQNAPGLGHYRVWLAHYNVPTPTIPKPWDAWTFWQHSAKGLVSGIGGDVDLDWFNGTIEDLEALTVPMPPGQPT